jgi:uncharacterized protein (TIGR02145 family)
MTKIKFFISYFVFFITLVSYSQTPNQISYQMVIRDNANQLVANRQIRLRISLLADSMNATSAYVETHQATSSNQGLVQLAIGGGTVVSGSFGSIPWSRGKMFAKIEIDPAGSTNYTLSSTTQLLSVPYALNSKNVNLSKSGDTITIGDVQLLIPGVKTFVGGVPAVIVQGQVWMDKNLEVSKYRNGDPIPEVKEEANWIKLTTGAWCHFTNNITFGQQYGKLYNWFAVTDSRGLCPVGWRMPTKLDFEILFNNLGGDSTVGPKLMEKGNTYWVSDAGTNSTGFSARGGGWRGGYGPFYYWVRDSGSWWTITKNTGNNDWDINHPWFFAITGYNAKTTITRDPYYSVNAGVSVRCIKD